MPWNEADLLFVGFLILRAHQNSTKMHPRRAEILSQDENLWFLCIGQSVLLHVREIKSFTLTQYLRCEGHFQGDILELKEVYSG